MKNKLHIALPILGTLLYATTAQALLNTINLPGSIENDTWNNLTPENYPNSDYGPSATWPAPIGSNLGGDAYLSKPSGTSAGTAPQNWPGLTGAGGLLIVGEDTPLTGLETIVFQLDYSAFASGGAPGSELLFPELYLNGTIFDTDGLADYFMGTDLVDQPHPNPTLAGFGFTVPAGSYTWQWDLSDFSDPITSFSIEWTHPSGGAVLNSLQLDQGSQFAQVVPEPSTYAALMGVGVLGLAVWRRRK